MSTRELLSGDQMRRALEEMADGLRRLVADGEAAALVGIRTRGADLARRLHALVRERHGWELPLGILDVTLYRDDLSQLAPNPLVQNSQLDFDVDDRTILLIDDVLYTGRTVRCALQQLLDYGRPRAVRLAVLVDRGGREIPIQADLVQLHAEAADDEAVRVQMQEVDGRDGVWLVPREPAGAHP